MKSMYIIHSIAGAHALVPWSIHHCAFAVHAASPGRMSNLIIDASRYRRRALQSLLPSYKCTHCGLCAQISASESLLHARVWLYIWLWVRLKCTNCVCAPFAVHRSRMAHLLLPLLYVYVCVCVLKAFRCH